MATKDPLPVVAQAQADATQLGQQVVADAKQAVTDIAEAVEAKATEVKAPLSTTTGTSLLQPATPPQADAGISNIKKINGIASDQVTPVPSMKPVPSTISTSAPSTAEPSAIVDRGYINSLVPNGIAPKLVMPKPGTAVASVPEVEPVEPVKDAPATPQPAPAPTAIPSPAKSPAPAAAPAATKEPAPPMKAVLTEAIKEIKDGGVETVSGVAGVMNKLKNRKPVNITLDQVVQALFFLGLGFQLLLIKLFRPSPWWLMLFTIVGGLLGLGYSAAYYYNKKRKAETCDVLGMNVGLKGLQHLLGGLPAWLSYTEREKIRWLNAVLEEVWPFYDKGVCKMVKDVTEGIFDNAMKTMKVPAIKKIGFKQLTFGDAPFRVESIYVSEKHKDAMVMEVDVRWCGEANITLAIELAAGEFTKMCPKVTDISFVGSLRIMLKPLTDTIPGFGAVLVTFRKAPRVKYRLDFGSALGGKYAASVVKPFINWVIDNMVINAFVWPQRLVVPVINTEEMQIEVEKMSYRNVGLVKVTVAQATGLRKADTLGSSDPFTEITTDLKHVAVTKTIKNTLAPKWGETFWLLVQEPHSQEMRVSVYDKDMFSAKELLTLNLGGAVGAKELLGRTVVRLSSVTAQEGEAVTKWYHLGEGDFSNPEGCGKGAGRIQLTCLYRSFHNFKPSEVSTAEIGAVIVKIMQVTGLNDEDPDRAKTVYVKVRVGGEDAMVDPVTSKTDHSWKGKARTTMEFHNVQYSDDIKFKLFEKTLVKDDEFLDYMLAISDVAAAADRNPLTGQEEPGLMFRSFKLADSGATLYASVRFVPYF